MPQMGECFHLQFDRNPGQEKKFVIQLPSGPVHFHFQFPPLRCYFHNRHAMFMQLHYQLYLYYTQGTVYDQDSMLGF